MTKDEMRAKYLRLRRRADQLELQVIQTERSDAELHERLGAQAREIAGLQDTIKTLRAEWATADPGRLHRELSLAIDPVRWSEFANANGYTEWAAARAAERGQ